MFRFYISIISILILYFPVNNIFANSEKGDTATKTTHSPSDHPPHDHQHHDHIKKLDEGMQRRRQEKKNTRLS